MAAGHWNICIAHWAACTSSAVSAADCASRAMRSGWGMADRLRVLHFISNSYPSGYFRLIAQHTDHDRFDMRVGSLDAADGLQDQMREIGVPTFALDAESRRRWPLATLRL